MELRIKNVLAGTAVAMATVTALLSTGSVAQAAGSPQAAATTAEGWEYAGKFSYESQCLARGRDGLARGEWHAWGCAHSPQGDPALPWFLGVMR